MFFQRSVYVVHAGAQGVDRVPWLGHCVPFLHRRVRYVHQPAEGCELGRLGADVPALSNSPGEVSGWFWFGC